MDEIRMNLSGEVESLLMTFVDRAAGIDKLSKSAVGEARDRACFQFLFFHTPRKHLITRTITLFRLTWRSSKRSTPAS